MRVFRSLDAAAAGEFHPSAVTIGNFDGVHRGHQTLIARLVDHSHRLGVKPSVVTFDPHPTVVVAPSRAPRLLSTIEQRVQWMGALGIEQVLVVPFSHEFSLLSPNEFVAQVLVRAAGARLVLVGENFRFGSRQSGDTGLLQELGRHYGFETEIVAGIAYRGRTVSSTAIRGLIEMGGVSWAARLLGRSYSLEGEVVPGHGIGSKQTVPTLNLRTQAQVLPRRGVYITATQDSDSGRHWPSITNVGVRPTFGSGLGPTFNGDALTIETFLLSPLEGETPRHIQVSFCRRVRDERKFPDAAALKVQILRDVARAQAYFRRKNRWRRHSESI
ncbi:MAG: bifunctional riboflavin kinase/FAD synthetase [Bryobacterales bacterium]|nr:bifunctional riboflavin kinase/FAD synthetase [Bryobacterales bacterium]